MGMEVTTPAVCSADCSEVLGLVEGNHDFRRGVVRSVGLLGTRQGSPRGTTPEDLPWRRFVRLHAAALRGW
jgi:hypothetical protein